MAERDDARIGRALVELASSQRDIDTFELRLNRARARRRLAVAEAADAGAPMLVLASLMGNVSVQRVHNLVAEHRTKLESSGLTEDAIRRAWDSPREYEAMVDQYMAGGDGQAEQQDAPRTQKGPRSETAPGASPREKGPASSEASPRGRRSRDG